MDFVGCTSFSPSDLNSTRRFLFCNKHSRLHSCLAFESRRLAHRLPTLDVRLLAHDLFSRALSGLTSHWAMPLKQHRNSFEINCYPEPPCRLGHYREKVLKTKKTGSREQCDKSPQSQLNCRLFVSRTMPGREERSSPLSKVVRQSSGDDANCLYQGNLSFRGIVLR